MSKVYNLSDSTKKDLIKLCKYLCEHKTSECELEFGVNSHAKIKISLYYQVLIKEEK